MSSVFGVQFDHVLAWLRQEVGLHFKVRSRKNLKIGGDKCYAALVQYTPTGCFWIFIDRKCTFQEALDGLMHELAHAMRITAGEYTTNDTKSHSAKWGREYAKLHRAYLKWCEEQKR